MVQSRVVVRGENKGDGKALKFKVLNFTFRVKGWGDGHRSVKGGPGFSMCAYLFINFGCRRVARGLEGLQAWRVSVIKVPMWAILQFHISNKKNNEKNAQMKILKNNMKKWGKSPREFYWKIVQGNSNTLWYE